MKKTFYLFSLILIGLNNSIAQVTDPLNPPATNGNPNAKMVGVGNAIQKFKATDFMVRFSDFKNQMETDVRDFIARQNAYSQKDVRRVQMSYDKTAAKFNQIMLEIKQDFGDKEKIKMINKFPDMYSNGLKGKIDGLEDFYKANFQQTLSEVTESDGSALLLVLVDLIKMAGELSQHFKTLRYDKDFMSDQYLQQNLVQPNKLPTWMELVPTVNIRTDVPPHPSRTGNSGNKNGDINNGNNNNGNNNNGNGNGNGDSNGNGGNNGSANEIGNGKKKLPQTGEEPQIETKELPTNNADSDFQVEGQSTLKQQNSAKIKQRPVPTPPNTEGVKKPVKKNNAPN